MSYDSEVLADSPSLYYKFTSASGHFTDEVNSVVTEKVQQLTYQVTGPITSESPNYGVQFDNNTDFSSELDIPDAGGYADLGDVFTIEFWLKRASTGIDSLIDKGATGGTGYNLWIDGSGQIRLTKGLAGGSDIINSGATNLTDTASWHHIVVTKDGSTRAIYLDGADVSGSGTNKTLTDTSNRLSLGTFNDHTNPQQGQFARLALYKSALSSTRVTAHYDAATAAASTNAAAGNAAGTGAANQPAATVKPNAGNAAGTGAASGATTSIAGSSGAGSGTGAAGSAGANVAPNAGSGAGAGAASDITTSLGPTATAATGTGAAADAGKTVAVNAGAGAGTGTAYDAAGAVSKDAAADVAAGTGEAYDLTTAIEASIGTATGTGAATDAQVSTDDTAPADTGMGTGSAGDASTSVEASIDIATALGAAYDATGAVAAYAGLASGTGSAYDPTILVAGDTTVVADAASGTGTAYDATIATPSAGGWAKTVRRGGLPGDHTRPREPKPIVFPVVPAVVAHAGVARGTGSAFDPTTTWNDDETALWLLAGLL